MIYSIEYLNLYLSVRNSLHYKNIEKISVEQLNHLAKQYDEKLFTHYKKVTFMKWLYSNIENKISFHKRVLKLIKKLNIELTNYEKREIESLEAREFTERRAFKTIEVPYKDHNEALLILPDAYFFYRDIRTYTRRKILFEKKFMGEIYITLREVVLYDRENDDIQLIIPNRTINGVVLKNEYIKITRTGNQEPIYLKHRDNELIYISLKRSISLKKGDGFTVDTKNEFKTTEKTIESFLNINSDIETKIDGSKKLKRRGIARKESNE